MKDEYPITLLCAALGISRSGYHAWSGGHRNLRSARDRYLGKCIDQAFDQSRRTYGYPRMTLKLRANGERVGKTRVARLMRDAGLQGRQRRAFRPRTTQSGHDGPIAPNRLAKIATITSLNQVWQTDITYIRTDEGWLYLAMVIDAFSNRIIGWAFSADLGSQFVVNTLLMAVNRRGGSAARQVVLHSDRGVQNSSARFRTELAQHEMLASMSRRGNCYDNSKAKAFFSTLKIELVYRNRYASRRQARASVFEWIEAFYNLRRRHTSIGGISPIDFEHQIKPCSRCLQNEGIRTAVVRCTRPASRK